MELRSLTVEGFRRFSDKTKIHLHGKMVSLVGPNEAGKTSILTALDYFSDDRAISPNDITYQFTGETKLTLSFFLEKNELDLAGLVKPTWFDVIKYEDGSFRYNCSPRPDRDVTLRKDCSAILQKVIANKSISDRLNNDDNEIDLTFEELVSIQTLLSTDETKLSGEEKIQLTDFTQKYINFVDEEMPNYVQSAIPKLNELIEFENNHNPHITAINVLADLVPKLLMFGTEDRNIEVPYQIALFNHQNETARKLPSKPLNELIALSGLNLTALIAANKKNDDATRECLILDANEKLKQLSAGVWTQSDAHLQFILNGGNLGILVRQDDGFETKNKFNNFNDRSDGYKQFTALRLFAFLNNLNGAILLIDELEQHLHYNAQADLVQLLSKDETIGKVIYTTHSAGCLPEDLGSGIRLVEWDKKDKKKSNVINRFWHQGDGKGFAPLLFGMGATSLSFFPMRKSLIGEGPTELLLLPKMFREVLSIENLGFQVVHGLSSINPTGVPTVDEMAGGTTFIVDNDAAGDTLKQGLIEAGVTEDRVLAIGDPASAITTEDIIDSEVWIKAVNKYIDDFNENLIDIEKIENAPDIGRIEALPSRIRKEKIHFAYNILTMLEADPNLKIVADAHAPRLKQLGETIRALFELS